MGDRISFFKGVSSGRLAKLQWKATCTRVYEYSMDLKGNKQSFVDRVEYGYGKNGRKYDHNILYELSIK